MTAEYIYEPLTSPTSIRILELQPGSKDDPIQCQLRIVTMEVVPPYEAMSYTWGSPDDKREIFCGGMKVKIPTNLRDVLRRVRDFWKVKCVWADAICINQSDKKEVGHQVRQMASIYSAAERVVVWLGLGNPFKGWVQHEDISARMRHCCEHVQRSIDLESRWGTVTIRGDFDSHPFLIAWGNLCQRPWFRRLWVVQEVGLAKAVLALFGDEQEMDFDDLIRLSHTLGIEHPTFASHYGITASPIFVPFRNGRRLAHSRSMYEPDFLEMLYSTNGQLASDPRDFVFALLGHPSARIDGGLIIEPNYQNSHRDTYHEIAITLLQQSEDLRVLSAVRHHDEDSLTREFPSWIPTWERNSKSASIGVFRDACKQYMEANAGLPRILQFTRANNMLQLQGFAFDTIDEYTYEFRCRTDGRDGREYPKGSEWPIAAAMTLKAFSAMSAEEKLYELATALMCGWGSSYSAKQGLKDFAEFRLTMLAHERVSRYRKGILPEGLVVAEEAAEEGNARAYFVEVKSMVAERRLFKTKSGLIGLGPRVLRSGDICCILFGGHVPFILRRVGSDYRLVGEAYIREVMQGEAVVDLELGGKYRTETFNIF
jgi:hypothetical protein